MLTSDGTGIFVYLANKTIPEIASDNEELKQAEEFLARFAAYSSGSSFEEELVILGSPKEAAKELSE